MNELKKYLIQHILESNDELLLKMLYDMIKLEKDQSEPAQLIESDFSGPQNLNFLEIQESIDTFFNPSSFLKS